MILYHGSNQMVFTTEKALSFLHFVGTIPEEEL